MSFVFGQNKERRRKKTLIIFVVSLAEFFWDDDALFVRIEEKLKLNSSYAYFKRKFNKEYKG